jgi:hypothetical protein
MSGRQRPATPQGHGRDDYTNRAPVLALSIEQACESLGVSWKTWHELVEPEIRLLRLGRCKRVPVVELERYIADHAEKVLEHG